MFQIVIDVMTFVIGEACVAARCAIVPIDSTSVVPLGLHLIACGLFPQVETWGYSLLSLRDILRISALVALSKVRPPRPPRPGRSFRSQAPRPARFDVAQFWPVVQSSAGQGRLRRVLPPQRGSLMSAQGKRSAALGREPPALDPSPKGASRTPRRIVKPCMRQIVSPRWGFA